jgi:Tripartite tricarboxylate transporter family receptor
MKLPRRKFLHLAAGAAALPATSRLARAQAYPARPVRIIVGFAAAGGADIVARLMGQWLSERLGRSFVIENRPGAGTNIATEAVVRALPDGYTLLLVTSVNAINATLYDNLKYNFVLDIAPVASIGFAIRPLVALAIIATRVRPRPRKRKQIGWRLPRRRNKGRLRLPRGSYQRVRSWCPGASHGPRYRPCLRRDFRFHLSRLISAGHTSAAASKSSNRYEWGCPFGA